MNVKHIIGLAAIVLGGMTSCSNILEEEGVANVITKGETGTLCINIETDASFDITTKSGSDESVVSSTTTRIQEILLSVSTSEFKISGTGQKTNSQLNGKVSDYGEPGKNVAADTYPTITAENEYASSTTKVEFGKPHFQGSISNITVTANGVTKPTNFTVKLQNSVITIDKASLEKLKNEKSVTIDKLYVRDPDFPDDSKKDRHLLDIANIDLSQLTIEDLLFVDPQVQEVTIVIEGSVSGGNFSFPHTINTQQQEGTYVPKNYFVSYKISEVNGKLELSVTVDNSIDEKKETITINPFPTTE